jgi:hypothetical protein
MKPQLARRIRKSLLVLAGTAAASFLSMIVVQLLMGGVRGIESVLMRSFMIGLGMALVVFLAPSKKLERYPWQ